MRFLLTTFFTLLLLFSIATPTFAESVIVDSFVDPTVSAEGTISGGFVPCSGITCDLCDFMVMANTVIKWLFGMAFILFMILAVKAGIKLVIEGNPAALNAAKESFTNAFIGLIIFLSAWLIVDTLLRQLLDGKNGEIAGWGPWTQVKCTSQTKLEDVEKGYFAGDPAYTAAQVQATYGTVGSGSMANATTYSAGNCTPASLQSMGMTAAQAQVFSCMAKPESGCNNNADNPGSSARGVFQILRGYDNPCHNLNLPACSAAVGVTGNLNCSRAFGAGGRVKAGMQALANTCDAAASNQRCNVAAALCLYKDGGYAPWLGNKGENHHQEQRACVAKYAK
jgi:hypothetical protein